MNSIDRIDESAELINSGLNNDVCGCPEEEWVMFDTYVTTHLEPDGSGHAFYETEEWESEELFDVKTMLELRAATAARLAEIYSTAYQELAQ